jgi:FkbM family methyltransferase
MHVSWRKRISRTIRGKLRANVLSKHGVAIVAESKNGKLTVDPRDFNVSRSLLKHGAYDWAAILWLGRILSADSHIIFVGAHIGALLIPIAQRSGARYVVGFEPSPINHRLLTMNIALNDLRHAVIHPLAVGDSEGRVRFAENPINSGNSRVSDSGEMEVSTARLDSFSFGVPHIDLMVMDTEGFEVRVMRGGRSTLTRTRYLYIEYAPEQLAEQGSRPSEFIELVASLFESMYLPGNPVQFLPKKAFIEYLNHLPARRGLLLNLLFSHDTLPRAELLNSL